MVFKDSPTSSPAEEVPLMLVETNNQIEEDQSPILNEESLPSLKKVVDVDVLSVVGKIEQTQKGPVAPAEITQRWIPVFTKGLHKNENIELCKKHIPFENMPTLSARLNPELEEISGRSIGSHW